MYGSFQRRGVEKDERALAIEHAQIQSLAKDRDAEKDILERSFYAQIEKLLEDEVIASVPKTVKVSTVKAGAKITKALLESMPRGQWRQIVVKNDVAMAAIEGLKHQIDMNIEQLQKRLRTKLARFVVVMSFFLGF